MGAERDDVLVELRKTGYPTEIVASSVIRNRGWAVVHNPTYLDDVENRSREFDIQAGRDFDGGPIHLTVFLLVECKKSDKPWVFFSTMRDADAPGIEECINVSGGMPNLFSDFQAHPALLPPPLLHEYHHYQRPERLARTFYEPFKGKERDDRSHMIYGACLSAIKAVLFQSRHHGGSATWANLYYPVIVFCGTMYEALVTSGTEIDLVESDHVLLSFRYFSSDPALRNRNTEFLIDVVRDTYRTYAVGADRVD